jgi:hypothetical protein
MQNYNDQPVQHDIMQIIRTTGPHQSCNLVENPDGTFNLTKRYFGVPQITITNLPPECLTAFEGYTRVQTPYATNELWEAPTDQYCDISLTRA